MTIRLDDDTPMLIAHNGKLCWQFPNGKIMPCVRGGDDPDPPAKTFTQDDVDRIVADRLARAKTEPPADYEALKQAKVELDKLKADADAAAAKNLTEAEATSKRIAALEEAVTKSNEATEAAKAEAVSEKLRSAFVSEAAGAKILNPGQAWLLLTKEQKDALTLGDDGQVKGGKEIAEKFAAENPHFVGSPLRPKPDPAQGKTGEGTDFGAAGRAEAAKRFPKPAEANK